MTSKMAKFTVFGFVLILFVTSGFCEKSANESGTKPKTTGGESGGLEAPRAADNVSETVSQNDSANTALVGAPPAATNAESKASNISNSIVSSPVSASVKSSNTSPGKETSGATNENSNSPSAKSGNATLSTANTTAEAKSPDGTGGASPPKTVDSGTQTQNSQLGVPKTNKVASPASVISSNTAGQQVEKKPLPGLTPPVEPLDAAKGKPSESESKPGVMPPPPNDDGDEELPIPEKPAASNKGAGLGVEENDDGLDETAQDDKSFKESKVPQVKGNRNEPAEPAKPPKMHYDDEPENSHFLAYLLTIGVLCVAAYVVAHNRQKIMGLILEGRQGRRSHRSGSTSGKGVRYKRLDHEEAEGDSGVHLSSRDGGRVIY